MVSQEEAQLDLLLKEKFTSTFRKGYVTCESFTMPQRYIELKDQIDNFEVYDDDVWVCSFPKTGTTWTQEMVWLLCNDCDYKGAEENLGARFPFLEVCTIFDFRELKEKYKSCEPPAFVENSIEFCRNKMRPRFIKTHLPWNLLPKQIRLLEKKPKIIYVYRNPKEVCISYYHHARLLEGFSGTFDEFYRLFVGGKVIFGPFWMNVLSYWKQDSSNVFFLRYQDMKRDLETSLQKTAKFLDKEISKEKLQMLLKHLSFESMKQNPAVNFEPVLDFHRRHALVVEDGFFMRSGTENSHEALMTDEQIASIDELSAKCVEGTSFII